MTGSTATIHLGVINSNNWCPGRSIMTGLADISRIDMRWPFTRFICSIMATETIIHDTSMIKCDTN